MSVHAARALIGWRMSSGSCHNYCVSPWKGVRTMSLLSFVLKSMYPGGWKLVVLRLQHGATLQRRPSLQHSVFKQLLGDVNIFSIVLSKNNNLLHVIHFMKFTEEDGPPIAVNTSDFQQ
jgi:hypothetical protein